MHVEDEDLLGLIVSQKKLNKQERKSIPVVHPARSLQVKTNQMVMPVVVIWMPTYAHSCYVEGPAALYRAILQYAWRACPRSMDEAYPCQDLNFEDYADGLPVREHQLDRMVRLSPWVKRLLIMCYQKEAEDDSEHCAPLAVRRTIKSKDGDSDRPPRKATVKELRKIIQSFVAESEGVSASETPTSTPHVPVGRKHGAPHRKRHYTPAPAMAGVASLRREPKIDCVPNLVMQEFAARDALFTAVLDELSYILNIECSAPPLSVLFVGDLPRTSEMTWPAGLSKAKVHIVGNVPDIHEFRDKLHRRL